ncbi:MAG: hypothetical protein MI976_10745 [Pseudomonadales bacterium]|nr:hypothetical protein [Pseudomonadales bacterium]
MELIDAFNFASNTVNQVIALSSGILALTVTFAKDHLVSANSPSGLKALKASWVCQIMSVVFGVWSLMSLTGQVASTKIKNPSVWNSSVTFPVSLQFGFFLLALVFLVWAAWSAFKK